MGSEYLRGCTLFGWVVSETVTFALSPVDHNRLAIHRSETRKFKAQEIPKAKPEGGADLHLVATLVSSHSVRMIQSTPPHTSSTWELSEWERVPPAMPTIASKLAFFPVMVLP